MLIESRDVNSILPPTFFCNIGYVALLDAKSMQQSVFEISVLHHPYFIDLRDAQPLKKCHFGSARKLSISIVILALQNTYNHALIKELTIPCESFVHSLI